MKRRDTTKLADLKLRVPEQIRQMIEVAAAQNNRTMSAEMVSRLSDSFKRQEMAAWNEKVLTELMGPPELRILSKQLVGAFSTASQQYALSNGLPGGFTTWNNDPDCYETATIATILALAADAPAGPTNLIETIRSLTKKLNSFVRGSK